MATVGEFRRHLVLQLFLRRGEFWDRVTAIRTEWKITVKVLIPPIKPRPPGCFWDLPRPEGLPQVHPALTGPATDEDRRRWAREDPMRETHRWIETLTILHDEIVPTQHRTRNYLAAQEGFPITAGPYPKGSREGYEYLADVWFPFLGNCVMYDPPPAELDAFAKAASGGLDARARNEPIVWRADGVEVSAVESQFREKALDHTHALYTGFLAERGLLAAFQQYARERDTGEWRAIQEEYRERREQIEPQPYISLEDDPDDELIRKATSTIRRQIGSERRRGRPRRDPLLCVQCAILKDRHGWTDVELAERFGAAITRSPYYGHEHSETIRQYIADGRAILAQEKFPE